MMRVWIGYDPREEVACAVCASSVRRHGGDPVYLKWDMPEVARVYRRPFQREGVQYIDGVTHAPFSTQFSFTRFLIPYLQGYEGWAVFCDGDFLFRDNLKRLKPFMDEKYAVMVVQHRHEPPEGAKMDGVAQTRYARKNWSSFVLWNCAHPSNRMISPAEVNARDGRWLHAFGWLKDDEIGALPVDWNYLVGHNGAWECAQPKAVHFTEGGPWWAGFHDVEFAADWRTEMENFIGQGE